MKTVMALAAAGLLGQALWTFGGETYLVAAAALTETHAPDSSADYSARALAGEPVLFGVEALKTRQDRTALHAARKLIREGELERAHHYLGLVDTKHAAAAAEAEALALSMTPRRVELIQAQLDQGKPEAALQAIARAEVTLPGTPAVAPATLVSLKAQALNQMLKVHLQAGHVSAMMDVAQDYPKDAPLTMKTRAEEALASAMHNASEHYLAQGQAVGAYRLMQAGYEKLVLSHAVGASAVQQARQALDMQVWGREVHAGLFTHPPLHDRDTDGLAPSGSIRVSNDTERALPVSFLMPGGGRQHKVIPPGQSHNFELGAAGHVLQLLELGDKRDSLTVVSLGTGRYLQHVDARDHEMRPGDSSIGPNGPAASRSAPAGKRLS